MVQEQLIDTQRVTTELLQVVPIHKEALMDTRALLQYKWEIPLTGLFPTEQGSETTHVSYRLSYVQEKGLEHSITQRRMDNTYIVEWEHHKLQTVLLPQVYRDLHQWQCWKGQTLYDTVLMTRLL